MRTKKLDNHLEILLAGIGAAQSLYLSTSALLDKRREFKNILVSLFFLCITVRIIKSLLWVYLEETPIWIINSGFWAHSVSGPLLFLYTYYFVLNRNWKWWSLIHFMPSVVLLIYLPILNLDNFWYLGGYTFLLFHQMAYAIFSILLLIFGLVIVRKSRLTKHLTNKERIWIIILVLGTVFLQSAYFSNYVLGLTPYLLGPTVYAAFIYFLSFYALRNSRILFERKEYKKYGNIHLSDSDLKHISEQIVMIMEHDRPFKETGYQLQDLSNALRLPKYLVSHVINSAFSQNFSDFINTYRIKEAKKLLTSPEYNSIKIAYIAFDCGFNSLSSFNQFFKRHTGTTPSSYKRSSRDL